MTEAENNSEVARIRQQIDAEREAAQRGLFGLAYGVSRHDFITHRMETVADEVFRRREQNGDQEAFTYMTTAMDALCAAVASAAPVAQTPGRADFVAAGRPRRMLRLRLQAVMREKVMTDYTLHAEEHVQPLPLNDLLGGLVHPAIDLAAGGCVLAVGREVGDWTQELAACYPQQHIVRVETSTPAVQESADIERKEWANVTSASVQDVLQLEDRFAPESFDLICVHFCAGEVPLQHFPGLMQSLLHLCKEQGHLVWLETDLPITGDDAYERVAWLLIGALQARGDPVACLCVPQVGIAMWMEYWLHDTGWTIIEHISHRASVSAGVPLHDLFVQQVQRFAPHLYSFLLHMEVATAQVLDELFAQVQQEMRDKEFFGFCPLYRFVCMKPCLWQSKRLWGKG